VADCDWLTTEDGRTEARTRAVIGHRRHSADIKPLSIVKPQLLVQQLEETDVVGLD